MLRFFRNVSEYVAVSCEARVRSAGAVVMRTGVSAANLPSLPNLLNATRSSLDCFRARDESGLKTHLATRQSIGWRCLPSAFTPTFHNKENNHAKEADEESGCRQS